MIKDPPTGTCVKIIAAGHKYCGHSGTVVRYEGNDVEVQVDFYGRRCWCKIGDLHPTGTQAPPQVSPPPPPKKYDGQQTVLLFKLGDVYYAPKDPERYVTVPRDIRDWLDTFVQGERQMELLPRDEKGRYKSRKGWVALARILFIITLVLAFFGGWLASKSFGQVPIPTGTGINVHTWTQVGWNNNVDMALIKQAGFKYVRIDLGWRWTETKKGVFNFSLADGWLAAADANGLKVILTLDYNNPLYSGSSDDKTGIANQATWEAYARWAETAARRYAGRGVIWEVWNEPNHVPFWKPAPNVDKYVIAGKLAYVAIRQYAGSNDPVIGPASTFSDKNVVDQRTPNNGLTYLNNCFARGLLGYLDGVSVHSYRPGQSSAGGYPETVGGFYNALNGVMNNYGARRPIVSSEWGYSRTEVSADTQARYLARSFLANAVAGVPLSVWYNYTDSSANARDRESNFGIVKHTQPRVKWPAFAAAQQINSVMNNSPLTVIDTSTPGQYLLTFQGAAGTTHVVWMATGNKTIVLPERMTSGMQGFAVTDYLGKALPNATAAITLDSGPKYLKPIPQPTLAAKASEPAKQPEQAKAPAKADVKVPKAKGSVLSRLTAKPKQFPKSDWPTLGHLSTMGMATRSDRGWALTPLGEKVKEGRGQ